jgi:hypothetical protein
MPRAEAALSRRSLVTAAAGAGALAAAASFSPSGRVTFAEPQPVPAGTRTGGDYRLTEHVKRYYRTTLV